MGKNSLDKAEGVPSLHQQVGKVLILGFKVLLPAAQTLEVGEMGAGNGPFGVGGIGGGKVVLEVGVSGF